MKYCEYCGARLEDGAKFCPNCGARVENKSSQSTYTDSQSGPSMPKINFDNISRNPSGKGSLVVAFVSFIFWWAGLVFWYTWRFSDPAKASSAVKGALAGVCVGSPIVGLVLWFIVREQRREYAKLCLVSTVIGVVANTVLLFAAMFMYSKGWIPPEMLEEGFFFFSNTFKSI